MVQWTLVVHPDVREWLHELLKTDRLSAALVGQAIQHVVGGRGPDEAARSSTGSRAASCHLKELRPASAGGTEIRILFLFDTVRQMVLLVAGDKSGNWQRWYEVAIPLAEARYAEHLVALGEGG
ncbi:type II toxin-antitoxin system RelE/ParE family toxin [Frankia canadensis]|nr:type II toxin-antitoxin system RelE/ParE family toxin [Frankia canadensis]